MKKRLIALALATLLSLTLVGCGGKSALVFNNAFSVKSNSTTGDSAADPNPAYREELEYSVGYFAEGHKFTKSANLSSVTLTTQNGSYTTTFEVRGVPPTSVNTDIDVSNTAVYHLTTTLKLDVNYVFSGNEQNNFSNEDVITSEIYFLPYAQSYMPLWSKTTSEYTIIKSTANGYACSVIESESEILYNNSSYTIKSRTLEYAASEPAKTLNDAPISENTYEYSAKTVIDNAQLIFATRNVEIGENGNYIIPTVSAGYGQPTDLMLKNEQEYSRSGVKINYNGVQFDGDATLRELSFSVNSTKTSGSNQYIYLIKSPLQNGEQTVMPWIAAPYMLVSPIISYGSFERLGSLVCTLEKVTVSS